MGRRILMNVKYDAEADILIFIFRHAFSANAIVISNKYETRFLHNKHE
jgi:hypothetical protein